MFGCLVNFSEIRSLYVNQGNLPMDYLKILHIILVGLAVGLIICLICRDIVRGVIKRVILRDPVYTHATISAVMPGTPSSAGLVNLTIDYEFKDLTGANYSRKNVLTIIKTINLFEYQIGNTVPVVYLRTNPEKHFLNEGKDGVLVR